MIPESQIANSISVIIPVHNRSRELRRALESLAAQRDPLLEVVVCDDGSTEDIGAVFRAFQDRLNVKLVRLSASGGPAKPRNAAVAAASAPWVSFLDSDDEWLPGKSAALHSLLSNEIDVLYHRLEVRYEDSCIPSRRVHGTHVGSPLRGKDLLEGFIRWGNPLATSGVTMRRALLLEHGGFSSTVNSLEDFDLWLRLASVGSRFLYVQSTLGVYWVHAGSISSSGALEDYERYKRLYTRQLGLLPSRFRPLAESSFGYVLARKARQAGMTAAAAEHFQMVRPTLTPLCWLMSKALRTLDALMAVLWSVRR